MAMALQRYHAEPEDPAAVSPPRPRRVAPLESPRGSVGSVLSSGSSASCTSPRSILRRRDGFMEDEEEEETLAPLPAMRSSMKKPTLKGQQQQQGDEPLSPLGRPALKKRSPSVVADSVTGELRPIKSSMKKPTITDFSSVLPTPPPQELKPKRSALRRPTQDESAGTAIGTLKAWMTPLVPSSPSTAFTARGLCNRAYYATSQAVLWSCKAPATNTSLPSSAAVNVSPPGSPRTLGGGSCSPTSPGASMSRTPSLARRQSMRLTSTMLEEIDMGTRDKPTPLGGAIAEETATTMQLETPSGDASARVVNPLKEALHAKKVDVAKLRQLLEDMTDVARWIEAPLDTGPPPLPSPLFHAIGAANVETVALLLEFKADASKPFDGTSMYLGWIRPGITPEEAVKNRMGRFVGTMLGDRLEKVLTALQQAKEVASEPATPRTSKEATRIRLAKAIEPTPDEMCRMSSGFKKSVRLQAASGQISHTQGHPSDMYTVTDFLGEGQLSSVRKALHIESGDACAIKAEMKVDEGVIWDEIVMLRKLYHPNIIQLKETFEDDTNIFQVLEICIGGDLFSSLDKTGGFTESAAARILSQTVAAVTYIHSKSIAHRDIQPENFLLKDAAAPIGEAKVKLIDFTTAKEWGPSTPLMTKLATLHYVAPEILTRREVPYTEKVDVWSLGVVFFVLMSGAPPFNGSTEASVLKRIRKGIFKFEPIGAWIHVSDKAKDLITKMLTVDVSARPEAGTLSQHHFFDGQRPSMASYHVSAEHLHQLRNFHTRNRLQVVVDKIGTSKLSDATIEELRNLFKKLDSSGGGEVSIGQVRDTVRKVKALKANIQEIMRVLWSIEGNGSVNIERFLSAMVSRHRDLQRSAFQMIGEVFDFDGNGKVSRSEVKLALTGEGKAKFLEAMETVFYLKEEDIVNWVPEEEDYSFDKLFEVFLRLAAQKRDAETGGIAAVNGSQA
mmetsp:Transcript_2494/g.5464  ORF Transcript_2494/g.5464 Transcript_2494/m.5464 type:complete len:957 (-) Transcript_2494:22-2892(-)